MDTKIKENNILGLLESLFLISIGPMKNYFLTALDPFLFWRFLEKNFLS